MPLTDIRADPTYGTMEHNHSSMEHEREQLLEEEQQLVEEYETEGESSGVSTLDGTQDGVRKIEAINMTWTTRSLIVAYIRFVSSELRVDDHALIRRIVYSSWPSARL